MAAFEKLWPYLVISGQLLVFFQIEHRWVQAVMLAVLVFQIWKKFKTKTASDTKETTYLFPNEDFENSWQKIEERKKTFVAQTPATPASKDLNFPSQSLSQLSLLSSKMLN